MLTIFCSVANYLWEI